jgi:signal transduction histidine kinase/HAMP domain-containing protein
MRRGSYWLGMRWWLAAAFALVAAITAIAVVRVTAARSEDAFRRGAEEFAIGNSFGAAVRLASVADPADLEQEATQIAENRRVSLYLFDEDGHAVTSQRSRGVRFADLPQADEALAAALEGRRFVGSSDDGAAIIVGLPLLSSSADALVAYSVRPELRQQLGIVRDESGEAALWAILVGAGAGLLLAGFIGRRLSRIAETARAIESGDFTRELSDRFPDEVGSLAKSIDQMRLRLDALVTTLRKDKEQFEQLVERLHDGILLVDADGRLEYANSYARQLFKGMEAGSKADDLFGEPELVGFVRALLDGRSPDEMIYVLRDNKTLQVSGVAAQGRGDGAILVVADVTQRERTERAQREFVTNAAHELRTPVAAIVTSIEMLQTGAKEDPARRDEFLAYIEHESNRLTRLTRALLVLARAEARQELPRNEPMSLGPVLERVAEDLEPHAPVDVAVQCDPDLTVAADPELLEQALQSIAQNAKRYTSQGSILIQGRQVDPEHVAVQVIDTGTGIDGTKQDRLFERFYRGNGTNGGFGLGLAIAAQSVRAIGGTIEIRSNDEIGTTVELVLPTGGVAG